jgi:predicted transcriptional regulator
MGDEFHTVQELFSAHENVYPAQVEQHLPPTRSISLRIDTAMHTYLEELAERWGYSKSGLGARLLEVALNEIELREEMNNQQVKSSEVEVSG